MGTTYKGVYIPAAAEDNWDVAVNANWTLLADREERIRKSADESVTSSSVLQNDNHLVYAMTANHTWAFKLVALASNSSGIALKSNFTVPGGASWRYLGIVYPTIVSGRNSTSDAGDFVTSNITTAAEPIIYDGIVTCGATPGNFQYQWAQNSPSAGALTVITNSYLLMKLLV